MLLQANTLNHQSGQIISAKNGQLTVELDNDLLNQHGVVVTETKLTIQADHIDNLQGKLVSRQGQLQLAITKNINNQEGLIAAEQLLMISNQALLNRQGHLQAQNINM
ncbi:MAG TPA: hypothetical protein ACHBX0_02105 [Arsenophonus sp.]